MGLRIPAHVLLIKDDVVASDHQHTFVPEHDYGRSVINSLDHGNSATEHCHAVTLFQGALPLATDVIILARLDQVVQSLSVVSLAVLPKSHALSVVKHEDVDAERNQRGQAGVQ